MLHKTNIILAFFALGVVTLMSGCVVHQPTPATSQAGPFVANISSDGKGGLVVEKCMVRLKRDVHTFVHTVEPADCTNTPITLSNDK